MSLSNVASSPDAEFSFVVITTMPAVATANQACIDAKALSNVQQNIPSRSPTAHFLMWPFLLGNLCRSDEYGTPWKEHMG